MEVKRPYNYIPDDVVRSFIPTIIDHLLTGKGLCTACNISGIHLNTLKKHLPEAEIKALEEIRNRFFISVKSNNILIAKIIEYYVAHPDENLEAIGKRFKISVLSMHRVIKRYFKPMGVETETITLQSKINDNKE